MAYSYNIYTGNGSTTQYAVAFPYIRKEHIVAYVNYTLTSAFTWVNDSTIQFTTAPGAGLRVEIRRLTPLPGNLVDFADGSTLVAADLDTTNTQHLFKEQELDDDIKQSVYVDPTTGLPTASGQRITNVLDPTAAQDAATKNYVDTTTVASAGDTMTGVLAMGANKITGLGNPTNAQDAATKTYVDTTTVASAGDTMTGPLAMGANKVTGLGEPTANQDAATKNYVDSTTWNNTDETIDSTETWVSSNAYIGTTGATTTEMDVRHDTLVQTSTPSGSGWRLGKTWLQNDGNKTLSIWNGSIWLGVASGGTFTTQPTTIYVDSINGDDALDGRRIINPKKTIKAAVIAAAAGDIIKVAPGVYQEALPIDITVANLSIVGEAQRSCFVHPTVATQEQIMFRCNSGTYIDGFTFVGLKASGGRGGNSVDTNATYGLPTNQGWVAGFYPGCSIKKSPYINNCTNFADSGIDNSAFNPNNYSGTGGDLTSAPTGGGVIVDGSVPSVSSPLRSFVINEFTQVCLDGPGLLVCNNGYAQAVSFFGLFCHYHAKALSGGQINMEVGTTDFGRYGLIADGKSSAAIFTATANGAVSAGVTTFAINAPTAGGSWFGAATRPAINMLVQVGSDIYPILSSTANGAGWNVVISRPDPTDLSSNLGLVNSHANGAAVSFFLRSIISTASHTMEYAGSGCNYNALPENGGLAVEASESINLNNGRVWLTSTDQSGKFKVGDTFVVNQQTGVVTIPPASAPGVPRTGTTGSAIVPTGSTGQRDASPSAGYFRFNNTIAKFEGYNGSAWGAVGGTVAGVAGSIQINNGSGDPGAVTNFKWDSANVELDVPGNINLDDGGTFTTTLQTITPTANRTISLPDATGTVALVAGSSGNLVANQSGAYAGVANSSVDNATGNITLGSRFISSLNGAASAPPGTFTGTWFTGGTSTTTKPQVLIEPAGATSTAWSTSGTGLGVNAASGFAGNLLDLQLNGTSVASLLSNGTFTQVSPSPNFTTYTLRNTNGSFTSSLFYGYTDRASSVAFKLIDLRTSAGATLVFNIDGSGNTTWIDGANFAVGTTTGTKIGTATTQKLGFYNKTPVVQPTAVADATTAVDVITQFNALLARMRDLGLIAT